MICTLHIRTHLSLNRVLLLILGLWPYQESKFVPFQFGLLFGIPTTFILSQIGVLITSICTVDTVLKILLVVFLFASSLINYASFYVNSNEVKFLIEQMQRNYDELKNETEIAIMNEYGNKAKYFTAILTVFAVCCFFIAFLLQLWPLIFNVILPINKTRPIYTLEYINEYILDQERYPYLFFLHANGAQLIGCLAALSTGTMHVAYSQHICGMFRITSYRMQHTIRLNVMRSADLQKPDTICERIIHAVDIHRKTLEFAEFFVSKFALWFSVLLGTGMISTSLNLLRIFVIVTSEYDVYGLIIQVLFLIVQYLYMFVGGYLGQQVIDHNNHVFATVYNIQWYVAPLHIQKIILFLLLRNTKIVSLKLGGILVISLQGFSSMINASISYFTVIYSMR